MKDYKGFPRLKRYETLGSLGPSDFDGSVDEVILMLQGYKERAKDHDLYDLRVSADWGYDDVSFDIRATRAETDDEYEARYQSEKERLSKKVARQRRAAERADKKLAKTEAEQRALYEKLKKKYGE